MSSDSPTLRSLGTYGKETGTRFAFRFGVTGLTTPAGAVLLNPPLDRGQLRALKTLNLGPAILSELSEISTPASDIATLIAQLMADGWLTVAVRDAEKDRYSILPSGKPAPDRRRRSRLRCRNSRSCTEIRRTSSSNIRVVRCAHP